jgi:DNA-binding CsgD family transcriptional regulator
VGAFLVERDGQATALNGAASTLVAEGDGLRLSDQARLEATHPDDDAALNGAIRAACHPTRTGAALSRTVSVRRGSGREPYTVSALSLDLGAWPLLGKDPAALVFVADPRPDTVNQAQLRQRYGLTGAEARVAHQIASGHRVGEAAEQLGISPATARAHMRRLLAKTGARGQADLVRLLLLGSTPWHGLG